MTMLAAMALTLATATTAPETRTVTISALDEKGEPVEGLVLQEVALLENGVVRELSLFERDRRPVTLLFLLDTSAAVEASFRLNLRDPVAAFIRGLPEGSVYSLWTTGDRPTRAVDFTSDAGEATRALNRVFPQGGNTLLDAIVEATSELKMKEGERSVVVILTATGVEFSTRFRQQVVEQARTKADLFLAVQVDEGEADFETRTRYDYVLGELTRLTGGAHERLLSSLGVSSVLPRLGAQLRAQYRLTYVTPGDLKERKLELKVARPGVRVRIGRPGTR